MSFLVEGLTILGTVGTAYTGLKNLVKDATGMLVIADDALNLGMDIAQEIVIAIGRENNLTTQQLEDIKFEPDWDYQYSIWEKVGFKTFQGMAKHGNYCSPGWTSGEWFTGNDPKKYRDVKPVDELDSACRNHDFQYNFNKVPRYQTLADVELITRAEQILINNPNYENRDYLRNLISLFKKKIFIDIVKNGNVPNIKLPNVDEYLNKQVESNNQNQKSININDSGLTIE